MSDETVLRISMSIIRFAEMLERYKSGSLLVLNGNGELVYCNFEFCADLGYEAAELQNRPTDEWMQVKGSEAVLRTGNGKTFRSSVFCMKVDSAADREVFEVLLLRDFPGKRSSSLLQKFSGTFMRDVNLGVLLINPDFELIDISGMACRILGMKKEEILNKPMEEVFASVPKEHQLVERTLLDGLVVRNHAVSWTNNEERYELLMDSNLLTDENGETVGAYVIFKDVSNLRSLEEQVQRSDRVWP